MNHAPHSPDRPAKPGGKRRLLLQAGIAAAGLALAGIVTLGLALALAWPSLPELHAMTDYRPRVPLRVYTADKVLIGEFGEEHRNVLRFDEIPEVMRHAVLAAEDDRFYEHNGIDWTGVLRAGLTNLVKMSKTQGASTITMQVARNFYLSSEKTYSRKFYELLLTYKIESELSKDQILELYMNQIYLGHRAYGFAAAARTYFGKALADVTPAEAAMLAGIPKAPSRSNPLSNFGRAKARQGYVLGRMQALGYLTPEQVTEARAEKIVLRGAEGGPSHGYAVHGEYPAEMARQLMYGVFKEDAYTRGIDVYTTIDSKAQQAAYQAVRDGVLDYTRRAPYPGPEGQVDLPDGIERDAQALDDVLDGVQEEHPDSDGLFAAVVLSASPGEVKVARSSNDIITISDKKALAVVARALNPKADSSLRLRRGSVVYVHKNADSWEIINMPALQAALVSLRPQDGAIRAMVGGFDYYRGSFNRVTQAWRQPGSTIKPFIYAAALERGFTPGTQISDQPFMLTAAQTGSRDWQPKNDNNQYEPMLTLREGLYRSKNMVSIRLLQAITPQYGQEYLTRFGFERERWPAVLPIALGAGAATPLQVANAYSVFANGGYLLTPFLIDRVTDRSGKVLMQAKPVMAGDETARAIDPRTAWLVDDIMHDTTVKGTAARVYRSLKRNDLAGKTGTTNGSVDVWFSGYNRDMVTTVWMGFDQPRSLGSNEFGSGLALTTWLDYASPMLKGVAETPRAPRPQGLIADNGNYYYTEFPPGQAIAALDLTTGDSLSDFLNNFRPADDSDTRVRQPGQAAPAPLSIPVPAAPPAAHAVSPAAPTPAAAPAGGVGTVQVPSAIAAQPL
ncbi:penicillin-binding protein [Bordetella hinzii]|uniref:penicillin-binding protein 1A n=1 Tax=Bordetella hinzii TaxID=103855 RepID=UPI00041F05A1|nr:PBP1A family penicillin-binding protein [Bordetella hinzii]AKQ56090.1 Penicillin-binding protein 1A [Bordetella hinzii]KCB25705.1 penicillin-binding protein, 1A family [Bordetella hinzii L60]SNV78774.1 penicillin-binding protein [Bordetella hinzii]